MALQNPFGLPGSGSSGGLPLYPQQRDQKSPQVNVTPTTGNTGYNTGGTNFGRIFSLPNPLPGDNVSIGDTANMSNYLANWAFSNFGGLTPQTANLYSQVLSGQLPEVADQLIAPMMAQAAAQAQAQVPRAIQQASDQLQGGARAEAIANATQAPIAALAKSRADLLGAIQEKLLGGALEVGTNEPTRIENMVTPIALIRAQQQAAKNAGGGK